MIKDLIVILYLQVLNENGLFIHLNGIVNVFYFRDIVGIGKRGFECVFVYIRVLCPDSRVYSEYLIVNKRNKSVEIKARLLLIYKNLF